MASAMRVNHKDAVLYLYGITRSPVPRVDQITGVDGMAAVESINCGGLTCWVSRVARSDFAENLSKKMEDLDWLAAVSIRHQRAVSAIANASDILPTRFGTVFLTESSLRADIENRKTALEEDFRRTKARDEWGIKVFAARPARMPLPAKLRSGREYLQAKSALLPGQRPRRSDAEIARFAQALEKVSVATAEGGKISGGRRDLQFQVSLLLKRSDRKKLESIVRTFSRDWKRLRQIECTGPWPPYSFVSRSIK
jgi:hypothetical protein